jgi:hypothetical protein
MPEQVSIVANSWMHEVKEAAVPAASRYSCWPHVCCSLTKESSARQVSLCIMLSSQAHSFSMLS